MIYTEAECTSAGGLYMITDYWYANHYGGPLADKNVCGTVVSDWENKGGHANYITEVENGQDITDFAIFITSEFDCGKDTKGAGDSTSAGAAEATTGATTDAAEDAAEELTVVVEVVATFADVLNNTEQVAVRGAYCDSVAVTLEVNLADMSCTIQQQSAGIRRLLSVNYDLTAEMDVPAQQATAFQRNQTDVAHEAMQMFVSDPHVTAANGGVAMTTADLQVQKISVTEKETGNDFNIISGSTSAAWTMAGVIACVASTMI